MRIAVPKESCAAERRVALVPQAVRHLIALDHQVVVEAGIGEGAGYNDEEYRQAGAEIQSDHAGIISSADLIVQVRGYGADRSCPDSELQLLRSGQIVLGLQDPLGEPERLQRLASRGVRVMALETMPRISRAQSMDVLSSMATVAGYKAVLIAANRLPKMFPLLMTAAGTVTAARVLVIGAGVAGLQAIATARRIGAVVQGYDIRPAAAEQIRSLGAKSVELDLETGETEGEGGYAVEQEADLNRRQQEQLAEVIGGCDVVVTTAAIPGSPSPVLITRGAVERMRPGSVIVDLAAERGGNCELTVADQEVLHRGVLILGPTDLASQIPRDASQMFSNNVTTLLKHLTRDGELALDSDDEITRDVIVAEGGEVTHPRARQRLGLPEIQPSGEIPPPDEQLSAAAAEDGAGQSTS